jgi:hypothetical protein
VHRRLPGRRSRPARRPRGNHALDVRRRTRAAVSGGDRDGRPDDRRQRRCHHIRWRDRVLEPGLVPGRALRWPRPREPGREGTAGRRPPPEPAALHRVRPQAVARRPDRAPGPAAHRPAPRRAAADQRPGIQVRAERADSIPPVHLRHRSGLRAYLQHARVQEAMRQLETTSDSVERIRERVGYTDPAAFRRVFRESTGLSPGGYREAYGLRNGPDA